MNRRAIITLLGGAAAWPLAARAQQAGMPVVGFMHSLWPEATGRVVAAFHRGLAEAGYAEGRNVAIDYRWARGQFEQLPVFAAELVAERVAVIVATGSTVSARAAKAATVTIPIVFTSGDDPLKVGLIEHLNRPGGNLTGATAFSATTAAKRLEWMRKLLPDAAVIALLSNPKSPIDADELHDLQLTAQSLGWRIEIIGASNESELDDAFASMVAKGARAMSISSDPLFFALRARLAELAALHGLPAIYDFRDYPVAGGLMSYGTEITAVYQQVGVYTGKILAGAKPADLPVVQPTKFELVINLKTAKALGIDVPPTLLALADEAIE
jgi:putative ABC transport system substrate-binding protein